MTQERTGELSLEEKLGRLDSEMWHYVTEGNGRGLPQEQAEYVFIVARGLLIEDAPSDEISRDLEKEYNEFVRGKSLVDVRKSFGLSSAELNGLGNRMEYLWNVAEGKKPVKGIEK